MKKRLTPEKLNKDISPEKYPDNLYFDAKNVEIINSDSQNNFSVKNIKGNIQKFTVPDILNSANQFLTVVSNTLIEIIPYTNSELINIPDLTDIKILDFQNIGSDLYVFTCDSGYGQIWKVGSQLSLVYNNYLNWSLDTPLRKIIPRFENQNIQKFYITDNNNYVRYINVAEDDIINKKLITLDIFPNYTLTKPKLVESIPGGNFKPGFVQYAYNLYTLNGAETKISPLSEMININPNFKGGEEIVSKAFKINISNIDTAFKIINVYKYYYTDEFSVPEVSLILEEEINSDSITFVDDNNLQEINSSLAESLLLGSDPFTCKDMYDKDNFLFPVNVSYNFYDCDYDARAFSFDNLGKGFVEQRDGSQFAISANFTFVPDENHDCINPSVKAEVGDTYYNTFRYQGDGSTLGAEGLNIKIEFITKEFKPDNNAQQANTYLNASSYAGDFAFDRKSLKRDEVYRWFIRFVNEKGQYSFPKWICDLRTPNQDDFPITSIKNQEVVFNALGIKVDVNNMPSSAVGWQILRQPRSEADKSIKAQGIVNPMLNTPPNGFGKDYIDAGLQSSYLTRTYFDSNTVSYDNQGLTIDDGISMGFEMQTAPVYTMATWALQFHSPEVELHKQNFSVSDVDYITIVGGLETRWSTTYETKDVNKLETPEDKYDTNSVLQPSTGTRFFNNVGGSQPWTLIDDNDTRYKSVIRKAGKMNSNAIEKLDILGLANFSSVTSSVDNPNTEIMDNGVGTQTYINASKTASGFGNFRALTNSNLTFQIGYYSSGNRLETNLSNVTTASLIGQFIVVDYKTVVNNQYGGNTYEAKLKNKPVVSSDIVTTNSEIELFDGDTFITYWNHLRSAFFSNGDEFSDASFSETLFIPIETSLNIDLRPDNENRTFSELRKVNQSISKYKLPLPVYNRQKEYSVAFPKPLNFEIIKKYDNRVLASNAKINGEVKDSWTQFRENNYLDVNGNYGEIVSINEYLDNLYIFQPEAIALLSINPNVQISTNELEVQLGKGSLLNNYKYLTTTSGTLNQFGIIKTPYGLIYYDLPNKSLNLLSNTENPLSLNGMYTYFSNVDDTVSGDNPLLGNGISGYYDNNKKEVLLSFIESNNGNEYSITYNFAKQGFHSTYDWAYPNYINHRGLIYSSKNNIGGDAVINQHLVGEYGKFSGTYRKSSITFIASFDYINSVLDNLIYNSIVGNDLLETLSTIRIYNEHQDTGFVSPNAIRKFRKWRISVPREENSRNRMMGNYAYIYLEFLNNNDKSFVLHDIIYSYRQKPLSYK